MIAAHGSMPSSNASWCDCFNEGRERIAKPSERVIDDSKELMSALVRFSDSSPTSREVRFVPILLQKSAPPTGDGWREFFEGVGCHPLSIEDSLTPPLANSALLMRSTLR